jgi:hypothetical protein
MICAKDSVHICSIFGIPFYMSGAGNSHGLYSTCCVPAYFAKFVSKADQATMLIGETSVAACLTDAGCVLRDADAC